MPINTNHRSTSLNVVAMGTSSEPFPIFRLNKRAAVRGKMGKTCVNLCGSVHVSVRVSGCLGVCVCVCVCMCVCVLVFACFCLLHARAPRKREMRMYLLRNAPLTCSDPPSHSKKRACLPNDSKTVPYLNPKAGQSRPKPAEAARSSAPKPPAPLLLNSVQAFQKGPRHRTRPDCRRAHGWLWHTAAAPWGEGPSASERRSATQTPGKRKVSEIKKLSATWNKQKRRVLSPPFG